MTSAPWELSKSRVEVTFCPVFVRAVHQVNNRLLPDVVHIPRPCPWELGRLADTKATPCASSTAEVRELVIVRLHLDKDDELAQHLANKLNTPLDWPDTGELDTEHVAKVAAATACDVAYDQAANGHLVDLFAALPLPGTTEGREFWASLERAGGDAALNIVPGNAGGPFFDRLLDGNETGIAGRMLSFLEKLSDDEHDAVADVIGGVLGLLGGARYLGKLWLRDAETSAWHVLLARRRMRDTTEDRERFLQAWRNA
ncbi:hypothetical protein [Streptomyces sp. NPDC048639]|uniref:hypothetical protein n=1 Tax=Streptomyces sp. NPDC048639 TaxID=3365581 RepID=UPI00371E7976